MNRLYEKLEAIGRTVWPDALVLWERPTPQEFNAIRRIAEGDKTLLLWKEIRNGKVGIEETFSLLGGLAEKHPHPEIETPILEELKPEDLQIISWLALC
jgi:hypothetical protein